ARHAEAAVDACVVFGGDARDSARLHERDQLVAPGIEEDVTDLAAFADRNGVGSDRLEAEDVHIEVPRLVQIQGRQADVRETLGSHTSHLLWGISILNA